jgi:pentatricopeptide repeat protein
MMGDLDRAFATWAELETLGLKPNTGTYNALLHTCVRTRELSSGRRLLSRMTADGVKPDSTTFMHQSSLYIMSKETSLALKVLQECKDARLTPSGKMYVSLINLLLRSRKLTEAQELLTEMESHHKVSAALKKKVQEASAA